MTASTIVELTADQTIYAHWTQNPVVEPEKTTFDKTIAQLPNPKPSEPDKPSQPDKPGTQGGNVDYEKNLTKDAIKTGDDNRVLFMFIVFIVAVAGVCVTVNRIVKKN